jgi:hypothetical protein
MTATVSDIKGGKFKVGKEVAEAEFERLCRLNRVEHDEAGLTSDESTSWRKIRDGIVRDIQHGTLIVNEEGRPTYTPPGASKGLTFHAPTAATFIAFETYGAGKAASNMIATVAELTRTDRGEIGKLHSKDWSACVRIMTLFLADE